MHSQTRSEVLEDIFANILDVFYSIISMFLMLLIKFSSNQLLSFSTFAERSNEAIGFGLGFVYGVVETLVVTTWRHIRQWRPSFHFEVKLVISISSSRDQ